MDKLITSRDTTISNDGATIIKLLDVVHPAAKTLSDVAKSQDYEVGDGTTSVTLISAELLREGKQFIEDGMHSQIIISGFYKSLKVAREKIKELFFSIDEKSKILLKYIYKCLYIININLFQILK